LCDCVANGRNKWQILSEQHETPSVTRADDKWSDLMRAAIGGDAQAYDRLLRDLSCVLRGRVRHVLARAGQRDMDVEDVVQEVLLAVHLKRNTWQPDQPFGPWVAAIARHKAVDAMRRRGWRSHVPIEEFAEILAGEEPEPRTSDREVARHLERLSPRQREVVQAIAILGASIAETAEQLKMSEVAVRVALHRGLASLAKAHRE
jgi:RNA polymerase sigma-70 factor (ECF subfamily)